MFKFSFLAALLFCALASNSFANKSTQIPSQCQQLFQQTEELISEAEKQPGTHLQIANIKNSGKPGPQHGNNRCQKLRQYGDAKKSHYQRGQNPFSVLHYSFHSC